MNHPPTRDTLVCSKIEGRDSLAAYVRRQTADFFALLCLALPCSIHARITTDSKRLSVASLLVHGPAAASNGSLPQPLHEMRTTEHSYLRRPSVRYSAPVESTGRMCCQLSGKDTTPTS